jgi:hypothetical protein
LRGGGVDVLREVHEAAERWDGSMAEWVRRSEARVRRWTWAPPGSELHMPQVFWHERDGEAPAQEAGREPMGDEPDRYGYDAQERVAIAYRVGTAGQKRTVECFTSPDEQGVVWGARYVRDGRLAIVSRVRWVDGVPVEATSYHVREPAGDRSGCAARPTRGRAADSLGLTGWRVIGRMPAGNRSPRTGHLDTSSSTTSRAP